MAMTRKQKQALIDLLAASLGGVAGALATQWLEKAGLRRTVAAVGVTAAGGVAAAFTKGVVRAAAGGVAAGGAGQLVATWFAALDKRIEGGATSAGEATEETPIGRNFADFDAAIDRAFRRRRTTSKVGQPVEGAADAPAAEAGASAPDDDGPLIIKEPIGAVRVAA